LIEHLNDPILFLKKIRELLAQDGYVLITTPNSSGLFAKYYSDSWRCIVDDHLYLFSKNNLKRLLERTGFKIVNLKTWGSIPAGGKSKMVKKILDRFVKIMNIGDVVSYLVIKD